MKTWVRVDAPTNAALCYVRKVPGGWLHMTCDNRTFTPIAVVYVPYNADGAWITGQTTDDNVDELQRKGVKP